MTGDTLLFKTIELELPETIPREMNYVIDVVYMQVAKLLLRPLEHGSYDVSGQRFTGVTLDEELEDYLLSKYATFADRRLHEHIVSEIERLTENLINGIELESISTIIGSIDGVAYNYDPSLEYVRWYITVQSK